jgi:hypothetical protein
VISVLVAIASLHSRLAFAQDDSGVNAPRATFEAGVRFLEASRFAEAAAQFERSLALRESPVAAYNLGLAYRGMGAHRRAIATLTRFCALARSADELRAAQALIRESTAALVHVRLRVEGDATSVLIDGEPISRDTLTSGQPIELDPGAHAFEALRTGFEPEIRRMRFEPGSTVDVTLNATAHPVPSSLVIDPGSSNARVRVDGRDEGTGRVVVRVAAGVHVIDAALPNGARAHRSVEVASGSRAEVALALSSSAPRSHGVSWPVWVGVITGVIVVGAAATVLIWAPWDTGPHGTWWTAQTIDARR